MKGGNEYHVPVLLHEAIGSLKIQPDGIYVDATFGGGGHSREILKRLGTKGKLIAFDQDKDAKANLPEDARIQFIPHNFRYIKKFLKLYEIDSVDGILADLGVSSFQINTADRGFSTRFDAKLDMRMNQNQEYTAADVLNKMSQDKLQEMFQHYGEVTNAKTLAVALVDFRENRPFKMLSDLNIVLGQLVRGNPQRYFAQVYQAIRIQVNDEMGALGELLKQSVEVLKPGGRISIITFHSLEDRMVKNFFKTGNVDGIIEKDIYGKSSPYPLKTVDKKPTLPSEDELKMNPRSRSAKLRVAMKV